MLENGSYKDYYDDDWEDADFVAEIAQAYPGWYLVKLPNFTAKKFELVKEWLQDDNVHFGMYNTVGWSSTCAYSVGVVFQSAKDAMIFKLRWC